MLKNYIKISLRNLINNRVYSGINILGLAVGLASCILILLYVQHETSYDEFHDNSDRIYRVALNRIYPDHNTQYAIIPSGFKQAFEHDLPEVKRSTRLVGFPNFSNIVEYEDRAFEENYVFFADSNFFDFFRSLTVLRGDPQKALTNPNTVLLTQSTAEKYFGNENPVGKTIRVNGNDTEVAGVMQDLPENSHIRFDFLSSVTNVGFLQTPNYISFSSYTYIELVDGADPARVESKIPGIVENYASGQIERQLGLSYEAYTDAGNGYDYFLQPIESIHLQSNLESEIQPNGSITYVYIFMSIALFVLIIAGINFVNLATARSAERAREVGVRKVMGSNRMQLIRQFLIESVVITMISLLLAIGILQVILPYFNELAGLELALLQLGSSWLPVILLAAALLVGSAAGLYPAFYISSLNPVTIMKGKLDTNREGQWLRNGLVVFQFAISIVLISGTLVVFNQMNYIQNKRLGFDKENVLVLEQVNGVEQLDAFKQALRRLSGVIQVADASTLPGGRLFGIQFQQQGGSDVLTTKGLSGDDHFFETLGIDILSGRGFSEDYNDSLSLVLNQAAVRALGLDDPVGANLQSMRRINNETVQINFTVVGVAENFNFESLRTEITPLAIIHSDNPIGFPTVMPVKLSGGDLQARIAEVEAVWDQYAPGQPFIYTFLDQEIANLYQSEQVSGRIFGIFAILAIIIACVGLFGLAAYTAYRRTKEIGVRKVLGATVPGIVLLLSRDFARLVGIAFLLALPVSWLLMSSWLENFAFRIELSLWVFMAAGIITLVIACLTVSYQAISAAVANPVNSLRNE